MSFAIIARQAGLVVAQGFAPNPGTKSAPKQKPRIPGLLCTQGAIFTKNQKLARALQYLLHATPV